jgi:hypothetical protein
MAQGIVQVQIPVLPKAKQNKTKQNKNNRKPQKSKSDLPGEEGKPWGTLSVCL